ncbi:MAG: spermidine synthase family protein, partial [Deltaproteobacteria bacterium]
MSAPAVREAPLRSRHCLPFGLARPGRLPLSGLFFASGFGALATELSLSRLLADVLGGAALAAAAVGAAYFVGLAVGASLGGRLARRGGSALSTFAAIEAVSALLAMLAPALLPLLRSLSATLGAGAVGRVVIAALVTLPLASLAGATLPACIGALTAGGRDGADRRAAGEDRGQPAPLGASVGERAGLLYGMNSAGAALGALVSGLVLVPRAGLWGSCGGAAAAELAAAAA